MLKRGFINKIVSSVEYAIKKPLFGCKMCGQCVLQETGLTCPMNCPKTLRNGPCGGVRLNGNCEVNPEMKCVFLKGYQRAGKLHRLDRFNSTRPPVDHQLVGSSAWLNWLTKRDKALPKAWVPEIRVLNE